MKKTVKVLIPVFLVLMILLCTVWYLFVYDRDFTRDVLLSAARHSEDNGSHAAASWFYDLAYTQSGDSDAIAIELAEQYKASGNYTKAENTLSNAISDGGGTELYIALCQTYVEQDKLLDAVNMLNSIANPEIKEQLDALRPQAPAPANDQQSGIYSQHISVKLETDAGQIYTSTTEEYPSVKNPAHTEPIPMEDGENTIYAVTVNDGLVSTLAIYSYTISGVVEQVTISDAAMDTAIREALGVAADKQLYTKDLWKITSFTVPEGAQSYEGLNHMPYLTSLTVENGLSEQLSCISSLANLKELHIRDTAVSQELLTVIASMPALEKLTLSGCGLTSISSLDSATKLIELDLSNNTIRSIEALSKLQSLKVLNLKQNVVVDLAPLATNHALTQLDISYNAITTIAPLSGLTGLTLLEANNNGITDLGDIDKLASLSYLRLAYNSITDISKIASCTALTDLDISSNSISDISGLSALTKLMYFDFSYNEVTELPVWPKDCALVTINGSHNQLTTLDSLSGLEYLNNVNMDYNTEITSVDALADCPMLIRVDVYGTKVTDVSKLTYQSVIVIYSEVDGKTE